MSRSVLYMSMSLDGFIAGLDDGPGNGLGDHGHRLHEWFADETKADPADRAVLAEAMATGAVVVGRRTFHLAGWPRVFSTRCNCTSYAVLFGQGRRLFDETSRAQTELELLRVQQASDVLHLRYRVRTAVR